MPEISIYSKRQHEQFPLAPGVWMLGSGELAAETSEASPSRLVIRDPDLPQDQVRVEVRNDGEVRLTNLGRSMTLSGGRRIGRGEESVLNLPSRLFVGGTILSLHDPAETQ